MPTIMLRSPERFEASSLEMDFHLGCRNVRRDAMKTIDKLKKDGMSEDEQKTREESIQELTDDYVKQIDSLVKSKQDELTSV